MDDPKCRQSSLDTDPASKEEDLSLYAEFLSLKEPQVATLPPPTATPKEVREYIISILKNRHDLPVDHVRRVAAKWRVGTGNELRSYTPQMYLSIFGREYGWMLYREINLEIHRTTKVTWWQKHRFCETGKVVVMS